MPKATGSPIPGVYRFFCHRRAFKSREEAWRMSRRLKNPRKSNAGLKNSAGKRQFI
jgi:hypothetical protein